MNKISSRISIFLILILVISSAFMPLAASFIQDNRLSNQNDLRKLSDIYLTLQEDIALSQVLQLLSEEYTRIEWGANTNLTADEAETASKEAILSLSEEELIAPVSFEKSGFEISSFLAISNIDSGISAAIWECIWIDLKRNHYVVLIDDITGKMVGLSAPSSPSSLYSYDGLTNYSTVESAEANYYKSIVWAEFLKTYYEFEDCAAQEKYYNNEKIGVIFGKDNTVKTPSEWFQLKFLLYRNYVIFNL